MSECDATVGQVAKGTTASFALGPHGASVGSRTEHALPGVGVVGGVFGGRIVPFALVGGVFSCVGEGADGVCGAFDGVALGLVSAGGVGVDEIGDFGALGVVFGLVGGRSDGVCGAFGGVGGVCAFAVGGFGSASAAFGAAEGETGAKRSASDGAGGADVDEATEEGAAERRLC